MSFICIYGDEHMDNSRTLETDAFYVSAQMDTKTGNFIIENIIRIARNREDFDKRDSNTYHSHTNS